MKNHGGWIYACLTALLLGAVPAQSADDASVAGQIGECARLTDPDRRLQCYDAIHASQQPVAPAADTAAPARRATPATSATPATPARTISPPAVPAASTAVQEAAPDEVVTMPAAPPAEPGPPPARKKPERKPIFGKKSDRPPDVRLTLIDKKKDSRGRWLFYFDNGEVWRQLEKSFVSIPRGDNVPVVLSSGFLGSHHLKLGDDGNKIKVKRVK